jgi:hypothetical protein
MASTALAVWMIHKGVGLLPTVVIFLVTTAATVMSSATLAAIAGRILVPCLGRTFGVVVFWVVLTATKPVVWINMVIDVAKFIALNHR